MKYTINELLKKNERASSIKTSWDNEYEGVFEYCMPSRDIYNRASLGDKPMQDFEDRRANLYSSVGEHSANEFVNTMQELLCPPATSWIEIEAGIRFAEGKRASVNKELAKINAIANEYKDISTFDLAFSETCYDVFAGTGCILTLPGTPKNPLSFRAIPIQEYSLEEGPNGEVIAVYRNYKLKREQIKYQWKELAKKKISKTDIDSDLKDALQKIIEQVGASSPADMGKVMGVATKQLAGKADGKAISSAVKDLLTNK